MNTLINYTKAFGFFNSGLDRKSGINSNMGKSVENGNTLKDRILRPHVQKTNISLGNGTSLQTANKLTFTGVSGSAKLTSGGIADRLKFNTGAGAKLAMQNGDKNVTGAKLSAGSKLGVGVAAAGGGLLGRGIGGTVARNRAENQALSKGLKPGTPEYNKFVKSKTQAGKRVGMIGGAVVGGAAKRLLGKNTFVTK